MSFYKTNLENLEDGKWSNIRLPFEQIEKYTKYYPQYLVITGKLNELKEYINEEQYIDYYFGSKNRNLLLLACYFGHNNIINYLVNEINFDINYKDIDCCNGYLLASMGGHISTMNLLESKGCNIFSKDKYQNNAYLYASLYNQLDVMKYLENKGFNIYLKNINGHNAYCNALMTENINIIKHLEEEKHYNVEENFSKSEYKYILFGIRNNEVFDYLIQKNHFQKNFFTNFFENLCCGSRNKIDDIDDIDNINYIDNIYY